MYIWWCCWWGGGGIVCVSRWICLYTYCHWHHRNWAKASGFWGGHWFVNLGSRRWRWNTEPSSSMERAAKIMRFLRELLENAENASKRIPKTKGILTWSDMLQWTFLFQEDCVSVLVFTNVRTTSHAGQPCWWMHKQRLCRWKSVYFLLFGWGKQLQTGCRKAFAILSSSNWLWIPYCSCDFCKREFGLVIMVIIPTSKACKETPTETW